jgi:hypothetical protein
MIDGVFAATKETIHYPLYFSADFIEYIRSKWRIDDVDSLPYAFM